MCNKFSVAKTMIWFASAEWYISYRKLLLIAVLWYSLSLLLFGTFDTWTTHPETLEKSACNFILYFVTETFFGDNRSVNRFSYGCYLCFWIQEHLIHYQSHIDRLAEDMPGHFSVHFKDHDSVSYDDGKVKYFLEQGES